MNMKAYFMLSSLVACPTRSLYKKTCVENTILAFILVC